MHGCGEQDGNVSKAQLEDIDAEDCTRLETDPSTFQNWLDPEVIESIRNRFVTGDWSEAAKRGQPGEDAEDEMFGNDDVFGDFEDLETGERHVAAEGDNAEEAEGRDGGGEASGEEEERRLKKLALRARFESQYPPNCSSQIVILTVCYG